MQNKKIISSSLKLIKKCPSCGTPYSASQVDIVEQEENGFLLYFSCSKCASSLVANMVDMPFGMVGSAMLTDLELNEVSKFKNSEPVSADDVLDVYKGLEHKK